MPAAYKPDARRIDTSTCSSRMIARQLTAMHPSQWVKLPSEEPTRTQAPARPRRSPAAILLVLIGCVIVAGVSFLATANALGVRL